MEQAKAENRGAEDLADATSPREKAIEAIIDERVAEFKDKNPNATEQAIDGVRRAQASVISRLMEMGDPDTQIHQLYADRYKENAEHWRQKLEAGGLSGVEEAKGREALAHFEKEAQDRQDMADGKRVGSGDHDIEASRLKMQGINRKR